MPDSIFDQDGGVVRDPKQERYEGDLKAELVKVILEHKHELGPLVYRLGNAPTGLDGTPWHGKSEPLLAVPTPLDLTEQQIEDIVDRKVTQLIGELLEFDHIYNDEFPDHQGPPDRAEDQGQTPHQ